MSETLKHEASVGLSLTPGIAVSRPADLSEHWAMLAVSLGLVAMTWFVFGQTLHHAFINFDDDLYVYENPAVADGLTFKGIVDAFTDVHASNWHPLTWVSHMLDCGWYGLSPGGHHLTSLLLHAAAAVLLFLILRRMTGALWRSAFVAAVFAIHPLRVESVAWVAERKDVLSGLFFMLTIGAYVRYAQHPRSLGRYLMVAAMLALGLMSKPMMVTLPFVLLLLDYWPLQRFTPAEGFSIPWHLIGEKLPLLALSSAVCVATLFAQQEAMTPMPLLARIGNALVSYMTYAGQMIFPVGLAAYYPHPGSGLPVWKIAAAAILLLGISAVALAARRKQPWFLFGWLWYLGMLVPVIGILQVGSQAHADRYTYLPQIGLLVLLTWAVAEKCAGWRHHRLALASLSAVIIGALAFIARAQTAHWRNSESLWVHTLACTSGNVVAHDNLGEVLLEKGNVDEAIIHFKKALQISSDHANAHNNLGNALLRKGGTEEAANHLQTALQIDPSHAEAHNNLGIALGQQGQVDEALAHFQTALRIRPDYAFAHNNLGQALLQKGSVDAALAHFQKALEIKPGYAEAHYNLGNALLDSGRLDEAMDQLQEALRINPDYADAYNNLGHVLLQTGRAGEAIACFKKALEITPANADAHFNLGIAFLREDRLDEALAHFNSVLKSRPDSPQACNNLAFIFSRKGKLQEATAHYREALKLQPDNVRTLSNLAWVLATCPEATLRNGAEALELALRANQLSGGQDPGILRTLAAAFAESAQFGEAVSAARKALLLASARADVALTEMLESQIKLYQAGAPFRDASLTDRAVNPSQR